MPVQKIITDKEALSMPCVESTLSFDHVVVDLLDTAKHHRLYCVGLASNQIGHHLRVFVVKIKNKFVAMVNPEYLSKSKGFRIMEEGCLSFPGVETRVRRHQQIKITYLDPVKNRQMTRKLKNIEARIFQHEMDHLNGVLI